MKMLMCSLTTTLGLLAASAAAEQTLNVDGKEYTLSALMSGCQKIANDPAGQIACFSDISRRMELQSAAQKEPVISVPEALQTFQNAAQYLDGETGLVVAGAGCTVQITYFNNYFHLSRRNISSIDLFDAKFDMSKLQYDQTSEVRGAQAPLVKAELEAGADAVVRGGVGLDSAQHNFAPRAPGTSIDGYASEVVAQLPGQPGSAFEFVLVHPQRSQSGGEIWAAFENYAKACKQ